MKKFLFPIILVLSVCSAAYAKTPMKWHNPLEAGYPVVQNQGWPDEIGDSYVRIPERFRDSLREPLWNLSRNSSGVALEFTTASPSILVRYIVEGPNAMPHMPATGVSGIDLYRMTPEGDNQFCFGWYHFGDTITFNYTGLPASEAVYHLNLPLYNTVKWLEIGVPEDNTLTFASRKKEKPVVIYGTSIAQGACSSRPGMAWGNILGRQLGMPVYNFGFSGNGRLEPAVISLLSELDAAMYVVDCLPNLSNLNSGEVYDLVLNAVRQLRKESAAPILLVEHCGYSNADSNNSQRVSFERANSEQRQAFDLLQSEGVPNLYYITHDQLGYPADAWVDYIHPSDLGAQRHADVLSGRIKGILNRR